MTENRKTAGSRHDREQNDTVVCLKSDICQLSVFCHLLRLSNKERVCG